MSYLSLYRKYRPQTFGEVLNQEHVVRVLQNSILMERIPHSLLFAGSRGTGKTSIARIYAKASNCEDRRERAEPCNACHPCKSTTDLSNPDVVEIDAASHRGVDEVERHIIGEVMYPPQHSKHRFYIVDEVHMLSSYAFNALLKTIEEPPPYITFIFATTAPEKVPATIHSRCLTFDFHKLAPKLLAPYTEEIVKNEERSITQGAAELIANLAQGSARDALSLLDQLLSFTEDTISVEDVMTCFRLTPEEVYSEAVRHLGSGDLASLVDLFRQSTFEGRDPEVFLNGLASYVRALILAKSRHFEPEFKREVLETTIRDFRDQELSQLLDLFWRGIVEIRNTPNPTLLIELLLLKAADIKRKGSEEARISSGSTLTPDRNDDSDAGSAVKSRVPSSKLAEAEAAQRNQWRQFIDLVKRANITTACHLVEDANWVVKDDTVDLIFPPERLFSRMILQDPVHKGVLTRAASAVFGRNMRVIPQVAGRRELDDPSRGKEELAEQPVDTSHFDADSSSPTVGEEITSVDQAVLELFPDTKIIKEN